MYDKLPPNSMIFNSRLLRHDDVVNDDKTTNVLKTTCSWGRPCKTEVTRDQ